MIIVRAGEVVAVDGQISGGSLYESAVTGEPIPVTQFAGAFRPSQRGRTGVKLWNEYISAIVTPKQTVIS